MSCREAQTEDINIRFKINDYIFIRQFTFPSCNNERMHSFNHVSHLCTVVNVCFPWVGGLPDLLTSVILWLLKALVSKKSIPYALASWRKENRDACKLQQLHKWKTITLDIRSIYKVINKLHSCKIGKWNKQKDKIMTYVQNHTALMTVMAWVQTWRQLTQ